MQVTDITPDFIGVDGAEGGTGAAPLEFTDHVDSPLQEGLKELVQAAGLQRQFQDSNLIALKAITMAARSRFLSKEQIKP